MQQKGPPSQLQQTEPSISAINNMVQEQVTRSLESTTKRMDSLYSMIEKLYNTAEQKQSTQMPPEQELTRTSPDATPLQQTAPTFAAGALPASEAAAAAAGATM